MLNFYRYQDAKLVNEDLPFGPFNMIMNQYYLSLGEFNTDNFSKQPHDVLCYLLFILATFFVQVTMLNMLIAIMSDTYERVSENKSVHAHRTKLKLLSEYADCL